MKLLSPCLVFLFTFFLFSAPVPTVAAEQETTFIKSVSSSQISLDPHSSFTSTEAQLFTAIYEGLVTYHPFSLEPVPGVARRWEISDEGTKYRFTLRNTARYSNGDQVTAQHVKDSWIALLDPDKKAEYASLFDVIKGAKEYRTGETTTAEEIGITAIDSHTLEVELNHPAPHFLQILCLHSFAPLHPNILGRTRGNQDPEEAVITNGPFKVADHNARELVLQKNEQYWDKNSLGLEKIIVQYQDDPDQVTGSFNRGEIHWSDGNVNISQLLDPQALVVNQVFSTNFFYFSADREPFNNPLVRRALALLLPWDEIRSPQYMHMPTNRLVPAIHNYPEVPGIYLPDAEKAMSLLEEAGYPEGRGLPKIIISIPDGGESKRVAGHMAEAWSTRLDTEVTLETHHFRDYFDALKETEYTLGTVTWIGDFADPLTFLGMWTTTSTLNLAKYSDPDYDSLVDKSMEKQGQERFSIMAQAEEILLHEAVILPIRHSPAINVIDLGIIEGWYPNPLDIHPFKYLRITPPQAPPGTVMEDFLPRHGRPDRTVQPFPAAVRRFQR